MTKTFIRVIASLTLVGLVAWGGVTLAGGEPGDTLRRLHHAVHAHEAMGTLITSLNLDEGQQQHIAHIHHLAQELHSDRSHGEHLAMLVHRIESENLNQADVYAMVDTHVDHLRQLGYRLGDELLGLLDSLDDEQRATLMAHLESAAEHMQGHGHGH